MMMLVMPMIVMMVMFMVVMVVVVAMVVSMVEDADSVGAASRVAGPASNAFSRSWVPGQGRP